MLVACCVSEATQQDAVDSNTVAYALSALAIMSQNSIDDLRRRLLAAPAALTAVTRAVAHYESCFRGVGFPHAMLCMLCHGPDSDTLAATLALLGLMPAWLAAREVSTHLVERASSQDVLRLLRSVQDPDQALESTISLTHLLPYSPAFLEPLLEGSRLEALAQGALEEMTCGGPGPVPAELISFLPTGEARPLELRQGWRGEAAVSEESCAAHAAHAAHTALRDASVVADLCTATPGGDTAMEEPLQLTAASRSMSFESYFARSVAQRDDTPEDPRRCTSALARLDKLTVAEACCGCKTPPPVACGRKRKRSGEELSPRQPFRKEDVGIPRYDALRFIVGGREVHAVGFVLETHSPFLRGLLSTLSNVHEDVAVPSLGQFSADTMHRLFLWAVEWCYTGAVTDMGTPEDAFELWLLAEFFQVNGLQRYCEIFLERYFEQRPEVLRQCMELTEAYPSAAPLRTLVARHVLSLLTATERCVGAEAVVAMHLGTYATPLAKEMAQVMRSRLLENLAGQ